MARTAKLPAPLGTYRDGVGIVRCRSCLQEVEGCYCHRPYWCTWCWATDGRLFYETDTRCCILCLQLGRSARLWAIGPEDDGDA